MERNKENKGWNRKRDWEMMGKREEGKQIFNNKVKF